MIDDNDLKELQLLDKCLEKMLEPAFENYDWSTEVYEILSDRRSEIFEEIGESYYNYSKDKTQSRCS